MATKKRNSAGPMKDLYRQVACQADQFAEAIFISADTQTSLSQYTALLSGDYAKIVSASIDPLDYSSADMFGRDYLSVELMSKYPHWDIGISRTDVALTKWFEVEESLSYLDLDQHSSVVSRNKRATMRAVEMTARRKILKMLGDFDWDEAHSLFAFGPGASTSQPRRRADASFKFGAERPHLSYNAITLASALAKAHPTWHQLNDVSVVAGSRLVTVPKNAKTDRVICIEPDLNMYIQKGIGRMIRRRLMRWGLLRPTAQQYNAELARIGSANGRLATVDLSSASDSIHLELVRRLLPPEWVSAIEQSRSPHVVLPSGKIHLLRKVSSMGNGFTFELETLIFYALCSAVIELFSDKETDRQCTVFGDDIIISSDLVQPLREVLLYFGFSMNLKKTFYSGQFRESCGKHYFAGTDVTPFYVRDRIDTIPRLYWAANTVRRYSRLPQWGLDRRWKGVYDSILEKIPAYFQGFKIPEGYGDGGLLCDWDEVRPSRSERGWDAWHYRDVIPTFGRKKLGGTGMLLKALHSLELPAGPEAQVVLAEAMIRKHGGPENVHMSGHDYSLSNPRASLAAAIEAAVLDAELTYVSRPKGFKEHDGFAHQWPSYGPWL